MTRKPRRSFTKEFKEQIVQLHLSGKTRSEIIKEYELTPSSFDRWVRQHRASGSFEEKDNRTPEQEELIILRKENQRLAMENDICNCWTSFRSLINSISSGERLSFSLNEPELAYCFTQRSNVDGLKSYSLIIS